ncbi:MAG TPA: DUF3078 domain-containing protein [Bacteroidia bacterium]|jgi:hypothetical protein
MVLPYYAYAQKTEQAYHLPSTITFTNNISASYTHYKNWKYSGYNNYSFLIRSNINLDTVGNKWESHIRFNGELGYMKFADSTWYKSNDYLDLSVDFVKNTNKRLENIFSFYFNSQFLSNYEMYYSENGDYMKRWAAGFGNPMNIDLSYGTTFNFWKSCRINLAFVTLRTSTFPFLDPPLEENKEDMIYKKTLISSQYGIGLNTYIRKSIGNRVRWENYSRAFANAVHREKFDIDFRNRVIVKIFRFMDFIIDSKIRYLPYPPYKFQFRNELMLSFTFEKV